MICPDNFTSIGEMIIVCVCARMCVCLAFNGHDGAGGLAIAKHIPT